MDSGICKLITSSLVRLVRAPRFGTNTQKSLIKRWGAIIVQKKSHRMTVQILKPWLVSCWIHRSGSFFSSACQSWINFSLGYATSGFFFVCFLFGFPSSNWKLFSLTDVEQNWTFQFSELLFLSLYLRNLPVKLSFSFPSNRRREREKSPFCH